MSRFIFILVLLIPLALLLTSGDAFAQEYQPLVGIPGLDFPPPEEGEVPQYIGTYINTLFSLAISIGGLIAVFKIIFAGAQYMLTDLVTSKESALKDIRGAFLGLLILLGMVLVFREINPDILRLDVFRSGTILQNQFEVGSTGFVTVGDTTTITLPADSADNIERRAALIEEARQRCIDRGDVPSKIDGRSAITCLPTKTDIEKGGTIKFCAENGKELGDKFIEVKTKCEAGGGTFRRTERGGLCNSGVCE